MTQLHATRRQEQAQESRHALMNAALSQFSLNGFEASSVHNIAGEAGVSDSLLYHYFPGGKKELLQEIAQTEIVGLMKELGQDGPDYDGMPLEEALESLYLKILSVAQRHEKVLRLLLRDRELLNASPLLPPLLERGAWLSDFLRRRADRGEIMPIDIEAASDSLNTLMLSHIILELENLPFSPLGDADTRRRLIHYQVGLWQKKKEDAEHE